MVMRVADRQVRLQDRLLGQREPVKASERHDATSLTSGAAPPGPVTGDGQHWRHTQSVLG